MTLKKIIYLNFK